MLLPEFDNEMANTRTVLERLPEDRFDWQPHARSMTLGRLANHLADLPGWGVMTLGMDSFDLAPPGGEGHTSPTHTTRQELLATFDANVGKTRELLEKTDDTAFAQPWTFLVGGEERFTLPRVAVLRGMLFNHIIHHRGQMTVYLRLNEVPVPGLYGPSADEQ
jgi:uncharacterized damage-inducible protein DinB